MEQGSWILTMHRNLAAVQALTQSTWLELSDSSLLTDVMGTTML
jgi:hypothetical protein